jgi:hypothetical protein
MRNIHICRYSSITFLINYFPFVSCFITHAYSIYNERSFSSAHTRRKCSFVTEIIQNVEYSMPMARAAEIVQNATAHFMGELA